MSAAERAYETAGPLPTGPASDDATKEWAGRLLDLLSSRADDDTQAQAQEQAEDLDHAEAPASLLHGLVVPEPGCSPNEEGPELYALLQACRDGLLSPHPVALGPMPPHAGLVMRAIAEHMQLLLGLRFAVNETRPLPYARSMAVNAGLAADLPTASRALVRLVRHHVIDHVGSLPPLRPGLDGTKLYAPPPPEGWTPRVVE